MSFFQLGGNYLHAARSIPATPAARNELPRVVSGGPLIDNTGHLAGLVTRKTELQGVNFAIPVETVRALFSRAKPEE